MDVESTEYFTYMKQETVLRDFIPNYFYVPMSPLSNLGLLT
jgi:hypothetical protein